MGLFSPQIPHKRMAPLCRQMATGYDAGIPIMRTLEMVTRQSRDAKTRDVFTRMRDHIRNGGTLGDAARAESRYLSPFFIELLATGEHGGRLDVSLKDLADYFEDRVEMRRSAAVASIYPLIQIAFAWFLGSFALMLVFRLDFTGNAQYSPATFFKEFLADYLQFQATWLSVFAAIFAVCVILTRLGIFKYIWGAISTFIWPVSTMTRKFALARFFRSMSLLITSGLRIDHCVANAAAITTNPYIQKDLMKAVQPLREGRTLGEAFRDSRYVDQTGYEMLVVGEEAGNLDGQLRKASEYYHNEAKTASKIFVTIVSFLVVLSIVVLVGFIVITFYMRYFGAIGEMLDGI